MGETGRRVAKKEIVRRDATQEEGSSMAGRHRRLSGIKPETELQHIPVRAPAGTPLVGRGRRADVGPQRDININSFWSMSSFQ